MPVTGPVGLSLGTMVGLCGAPGASQTAEIVNCRAFEVAPPGLTTVTDADPAAAMSAAGMLPFSCVEETNTVGRGDPFQRIVDPATKPEPVT
jgi:hypothetical protein